MPGVRAVQITRFGGPEVLTPTEVEAPTPREGMLLVEVDAAGVNYADTHQTEDSYLAPQRLPMIPGGEVVGRVRGGDRAGTRVVALLAAGGGYAEQALAHPAATFEVPQEVSDGEALALVLQGTTAWHLLRSTTRMAPGESVVVHAAAGGVGTLAVQLARHWGAGAHVAVDVSQAADGREVRDLLVGANEGREVDVVLEMTGGAVFDGSLAALAPFGRLAVYGMASRRRPAPVQPGMLMATSRTVAGFWLVHALRLPGGLGPAMEELLSLLRAGRLRPVTGATRPLAEARLVHEELRARRTTGKQVLSLR